MGALGLDRDGPMGVTHHWLAVDQTLDVMLDRGAIDACTAIRPQPRVTAGDPTVVDRWGGTRVDGNPHLRRLLDDDGEEVVSEFFRKTGCFQANHHVIVQNRILKDHPWVTLGKTVERAIRGSLEQGLLRRPRRLEDIYYRTTLNT